ncbi:nitrate regulatory protein [Alteromonas lipotrueiana]|uniref:nitrate regulatory protein n=1 Tax=Alteromonas lipotrueiana TaxID=2803815 RepID=UPI001C46984C|nr:nitrate regulatory protein [Alteromonas lipotrueiana]
MPHYTDATKRFLLTAKHAEIAALKQLSGNCRLVISLTNVIHQLQRERGASNVYLCSQGNRFASQLQAQHTQSIQSETTLKSHLNSMYLNEAEQAGNMRLLGSIALALQGIDNVSFLRDQITKTNISAMDATQAYCRLINSLLAVIFEAADVASEPAITRRLVALFNFIQSKEFAGQERAWGAIGFAKTHFNTALCDRLEHLQQQQQFHVDIFLEFCDDHARDLWRQTEQSEATRQQIRLRTMIKQLADGSPIDGQLSEIWYEVASSRIDEMQTVEEWVTNALITLTAKRLQHANQSLKNHKIRLRKLSAQPTNLEQPPTVLFDPAAPGLQDAETAPVNTATNNNFTVQRSFYDLLREQSEHIREMSSELDAARQALIDQKAIDRAKLLLMQQWQLTESQAYRRLQKHAMEQNMRIADIAGRVVNSAAGR